MRSILPWHIPVVERLRSSARSGSLPNALALTGAPGWGHESLLANAAFALLELESDQPPHEFAHPDFRWIAPEGAVIKVDQVRRINDFAVQTAQSAPRKVAAILDAHLLNANAANALLKTLEEPPPNTHLLLSTPYWGKLLPTIRSRCQRYHTASDAAAAQSWLEKQGISVSELEFAEFGYAPIGAQLGKSDSEQDLTDWLSKLPEDSLAAADTVLNGDVVEWLGRWYRRLILHMGGQSIPGCGIGQASLIRFADEIISARRQIESSNAANAKLLLQSLIVRWLQLQRRPAA